MSLLGRGDHPYNLRSRRSKMVPYTQPFEPSTSFITDEMSANDEITPKLAVDAFGKDHPNGKSRDKKVYRTRDGALVNSVPGEFAAETDTVAIVSPYQDGGTDNLVFSEEINGDGSGASRLTGTEETSFIDANTEDTQPLIDRESSDGEDGVKGSQVKIADSEETSLQIVSQVTLPYIIAGFGMVAAGMVLDQVQVGKNKPDCNIYSQTACLTIN